MITFDIGFVIIGVMIIGTVIFFIEKIDNSDFQLKKKYKK